MVRDLRRHNRRLPRGIPAASLKPIGGCGTSQDHRASSAGNTRGLIEACGKSLWPGIFDGSLPRGIPAASLKLPSFLSSQECLVRLPRGIPAASLKPVFPGLRSTHPRVSSAGNTRGLIEARRRTETVEESHESSAGNTRGLIEASAIQIDYRAGVRRSSAGNTRGLIEACRGRCRGCCRAGVFRGEYPRPH